MTGSRLTGKLRAGLNDFNQGFEAGLFHPDFGNEVVNGRIFLDHRRLRFLSDSMEEEIPMEEVELDFEKGGGRIYFSDPNRPDLKIFTTNQAILKHPVMRQSVKVQSKATLVLGQRELKRAVRATIFFIVGCAVVTWFCSIALGFMVRTIAAGVPMEWEEK